MNESSRRCSFYGHLCVPTPPCFTSPPLCCRQVLCPLPSLWKLTSAFLLAPLPPPLLLFTSQDAETVGRVLSQIDKCNGYILGAHDTAAANTAAGSSNEGRVSSLFRTAFSDTHEPMFEKVGSVQERYMPGTYGAAVTPELELMVNGAGAGGGARARGEEL